MKENEKFKIEISGHTDAVGDAKTNLRISLLRAQSVALYIVSQGIEKERIVAKGFGSAKPIASNDQEEEGRELNRRIEVLVLE
jgi:outer membrane protein OmpA-like peptidoglycan-associated protein